nr:hypothetical protein CFP56_00291 [Quercus suber]
MFRTKARIGAKLALGVDKVDPRAPSTWQFAQVQANAELLDGNSLMWLTRRRSIHLVFHFVAFKADTVAFTLLAFLRRMTPETLILHDACLCFARHEDCRKGVASWPHRSQPSVDEGIATAGSFLCSIAVEVAQTGDDDPNPSLEQSSRCSIRSASGCDLAPNI